jgi:hypothetical protein
VTVELLPDVTEPGALDELAGALAAFQAEVPVIPKKQTANVKSERGASYSYTYADLATIAPVVMPLLAKHGLSFTALPTRTDEGVALLVGMLLHSSGQYLSGELPITGRTPQEIGSSLTYGRRYLLGCLCGVVTDDDDDGRLAQEASSAAARGRGLAGATPSRGGRPSGPRERPAEPPEQQPYEQQTPDRPIQRSGPDPATQPLNTSSALAKAMYAAIREAGIPQDRVHDLLSEVTGRAITSSKELTEAEAHRVLRFLPERVPVAPPPEEGER